MTMNHGPNRPSDASSPKLTLEMFSGLEPQLKEALAIRMRVFVEEQGVDPALEIDDDDAVAWHVLARLDGEPIGTARLVMLDQLRAKIGRVAVLPEVRGMGIATQLVKLLMEYARREGRTQAILDSQLPVMPLYEKLGFTAVGEVFLDADILHRRMIRKL
ncbi:putative N-acetyltransferase YjcF [compost metagenome]